MAGHLWALIQAHIDNQRYRPSERQIAAELGVSPQAMTKWKRPVGLPARDSLVRIARLTGVPYRDVLDAALTDIGYIDAPRESDRHDAAPNTQARDDSGQQWDRHAAPLRAAGYTEKAIRDALGVRPLDRPGELGGSVGGERAGQGEGDRRARRTS